MKLRTDFDIELEQLDQRISDLTLSAKGGQSDADRITRIVYGLYRRASLTGSFADFEVTETTIDNAIAQVGPSDLKGGQSEADRSTRIVYGLYRRPSLTGSFADFEVTETTLDNAIAQVGP